MNELLLTITGMQECIDACHWLRSNCPDLHAITSIRHYGESLYDVTVSFDRPADAMLFKLTWGGSL